MIAMRNTATRTSAEIRVSPYYANDDTARGLAYQNKYRGRLSRLTSRRSLLRECLNIENKFTPITLCVSNTSKIYIDKRIAYLRFVRYPIQ